MTASFSFPRRTPSYDALITLAPVGASRDPSASEYILSRKPERQHEERRVIEHVCATFAGTPKPAPLWPKTVGLRRMRVDLDAIPWSRLSADQLREIAIRQYAGCAVGPLTSQSLAPAAPGEPLRRRPVRRPAGHGAARRRVFALRKILETAHAAGRLSADAFVERYEALRGH